MTKEIKTAIFAGTFNPFTIGHRSIVERGLNLFDKVVIAIGFNPDKPVGNLDERVAAIRRSFAHEPRVEVCAYSGLTANFAREIGASAILRGVRSVTDLEYERNLADANMEIMGMETVFLLSLPQYSYISSSLVRELASHGHDTSSLLG